jgi:phosphate starvation-inducible PhoH-like protein
MGNTFAVGGGQWLVRKVQEHGLWPFPRYFSNPYSMAVSSREKRKLRRQTEVTEQKIGFESRGMDILPVKFQTYRQEEFHRMMMTHTVTIAHGSAGTGKTLVALWTGLSLVAKGDFDKVVYVRSDVGVEFQRGRGALPGDMSEKIAPLLGPVMDNLPVCCRSHGSANYLLEKGIVEPLLLEDIRGRSLNNAFVVVDEVQNFLPMHVKTCLTRVGQDSKMVLIGDTKQADLDVFRRENGLVDAIYRLRQLKDVGIMEFHKEDIVRNSVIAHVLDRYDD